MPAKPQTLIAFATSWGPKYGGINSFNYDLLRAFVACTYIATETVCVVPGASAGEITEAGQAGVKLISLGELDASGFTAGSEALAWQCLRAQLGEFDAGATVWLGHDRISGAIALAAAKQRGGRAALIHHMSYAAYEGFAENSAGAQDKVDEQAGLFRAADIRLAVGPLLRDALQDLLDCRDVVMLVPGLAAIDERAHPSNKFTGFLSGRLNPSAQ
jgi:hypothetical protein